MLVSALVHALGLTDFKAPYEIVNAAQVVLGVVVGCRFAGSAPKLILRVIALSIGSTAILVAWTMMFAWGVAALAGYDARTLVLAYSPGGLAEMSLIAVALNTEVAFVAGLHVIRIALVMMLADRVFRWVGPKQPPRHSG
jgi:membrane AbrB-like protein